MAAPPPEANCCSREAWAEKPLDACMWGTLVMGILTGIIGLACVGIGAGGYGGTVIGSIMVIIGGIVAIPAVFMKCKACMIAFVPIVVILCIVGGIIVGAVGLVGGIVGAICDALKEEDKLYLCDQTKIASPKCNAILAYTGDATCTKAMSAGDKTCCKGMYAAKKTRCMQKEDEVNCKKGKASHTAGFIGIVAAIFGCITSCLACCTCCMSGSFFSLAHLQGPAGVPAGQPAPAVVVATPAVAQPEAAKA